MAEATKMASATTALFSTDLGLASLATKDPDEVLSGTKDVGYRGFQTMTKSGRTC